MIYVVQTDDINNASGNMAFSNLKDAIAYFDQINIDDLYESNSTDIIRVGITEEDCIPIHLIAVRTPKTKKEIINFYNYYA
jgi:hypothetical protein